MSQSNLGFAPTLAIVDGKPTTLSTDVARHFGKQHRNVLQAIENLLPQLSQEYLLNFQQASVEVDQPNGGKASYPAYRLTRDGFTLLAMGFTGKKALQFKLAYIDAFNKMEAELQKPAHDANRINKALSLVAEVMPHVSRAIFDAVITGQNWQAERFMLSFDVDSKGLVPRAKKIDSDAYVLPMDRFHDAINSQIVIEPAVLARLAATCTDRLSRMAREARPVAALR